MRNVIERLSPKMQSSWRDNNDRILDEVRRVRRVGFLLFPSATV